MYILKEGIIYNQIGKEVVIKVPEKKDTIFLNETASVIFKAVVGGNEVRDEIISKYEFGDEDYKMIKADVDEVLKNLVELGVIYEN